MLKRATVFLIIVCFSCTFIITPQAKAAEGVLNLPTPGTMVNLSPAYEPVLMKGLKVHPENPFAFDFILDSGNSNLSASDPRLKKESNKLIKYFLAAMTVPEKDLWVNLSPYEKDRMIADNLAQTEMGRDMLAQDYILKQLTASLIYPEKGLGKTFWDEIYAKARQMYGSTQIPVNTFNKVWIVADKADVFEKGNTAYVVGAHLKVMLEEDYLALKKHEGIQSITPVIPVSHYVIPAKAGIQNTNNIGSQIIRSIILPAIEKEVNEGNNFVSLRQMYYSMILASWYKTALKQALLTQIYGDQSKVKAGINQANIKDNQAIFNRYLQAYKKGVFNYIKDDVNPITKELAPRKYFSGGTNFAMLAEGGILNPHAAWNPAAVSGSTYLVSGDAAMINLNQDKILKSIAKQVLWRSTKMIDIANKDKGPIKVGGHQAAAASSLHIMMALELVAMAGQDHVAHKPHASPIYHSIRNLLGELEKDAMYRLRENLDSQPGLHSYPGMADLDGVTIPTGSVGLGPAAAIGLALAQKLLKEHGFPVPDSHFYGVLGDGEFAEGNLKEMLPLARQYHLDNVIHIVDYNRQSLDGNTEDHELGLIKGTYEASGWKVIDLKWGRLISEAFARQGGEVFRSVMDQMTQANYQHLVGQDGGAIRHYLINEAPELETFMKDYNDAKLYELFTDLGGHDLVKLTETLIEAKNSHQPVAIIAHTIKGWGLKPAIGKEGNHSQLLTDPEMEALRKNLGFAEGEDFPDIDEHSEEGTFLREVKERLDQEREKSHAEIESNRRAFLNEFGSNDFPQRIAVDISSLTKKLSTQAYLGFIIDRLHILAQKPDEGLSAEERALKAVARRFITISPDVGSSTIASKQASSINAQGFHLRFGIAEMNAVTEAAALGKSEVFSGVPIFPLVSIYDMFLFRRALDPFFYGQYWGSRFIAVGTPSGSTLSPEGAQHQSNIEPVIAEALPNTIVWEPSTGIELEYILADTLQRMAVKNDTGRNAVYIRCSTLPIERAQLLNRLHQQKIYEGKNDVDILDLWSKDLLEGGYRLVDYRGHDGYEPGDNVINIVAAGTMVQEALKASDELLKQGYYANVIVVSSSSLLKGHLAEKNGYKQLNYLIPDGKDIWGSERFFVPTVTVADAAPQYLSGIGDRLGLLLVKNLGLTKNGLSTRRPESIYAYHGIDKEAIEKAALELIQDRNAGKGPAGNLLKALRLVPKSGHQTDPAMSAKTDIANKQAKRYLQLHSQIEALLRENPEIAIKKVFDYIDGEAENSFLMPVAIVTFKKIASKLGTKRLAEIMTAMAQEAAKENPQHDVLKTPLVKAPLLGSILGKKVWVKAEYLQTTGAFKPRYWPYIARQLIIKGRDKVRELISASTGNHGISLTYIAKTLGIHSTIFVSSQVSNVKLEAITRYGGKYIREYDNGRAIPDFNGASDAAIEHFLNHKDSVIMVPHSSPTVVAGYGSLPVEIIQQLQSIKEENKPTVILVPVGEGGLALSVAVVAKGMGLHNVKVIGVGTEHYNSLELSLKEGKIVRAKGEGDEGNGEAGYLVEDGIAVNEVTSFSLALAQIFSNEIQFVHVSRKEAQIGMNLVYRDTSKGEGGSQYTPEGATGAVVAALLKYPAILKGIYNVVVVSSGGNVGKDTWDAVYNPDDKQVLTEVLKIAADPDVKQKLEQKVSKVVDAAMLGAGQFRANATNGGIDLAPSSMQMNIRKHDHGVQIRFDPAAIERIKHNGFDGLEFHIESITLVSDLPLFLGLTPTAN